MPVIEAASMSHAHLNVQWLRPESALWDAIASSVLSDIEFHPPSMDLGSGNGIFSFITAGGRFSLVYDWYRNVRIDTVAAHEDCYDVFRAGPKPDDILEAPEHRIDCAVDLKPTLLRQAAMLGFYRHTVLANANQRLPFADGAFQTVFSNILYWLDSPETVFLELHRLLRPKGQLICCLPDPTLLETCLSYQWRQEHSELLRLLNRARLESIR